MSVIEEEDLKSENMFCSPGCGNRHFNLSKGDEDYL